MREDSSPWKEQIASLPVNQYKAPILQALSAHAVLVCIGETGSGKTTQIPQFLLEFIQKRHAAKKRKKKKQKRAVSMLDDSHYDEKGDGSNTNDSTLVLNKEKDEYEESEGEGEDEDEEEGMIAITQPRRVATIAVAKRVAEELHEDRVGDLVGYTIRFDDCSSSRTKIKFVTDGTLVRECLDDPMLRKYKVIMLDEAHERSIYTDILFGLLKNLVAQRKDLKLIITSATLNYEKFARFFDACPVISIPGRIFPVDIYHSKQHQIMGKSGPVSTYVQAAIETTLQIHFNESEGHVLVFMTGQDEIEKTCQGIEKAIHQRAKEEVDRRHEREASKPCLKAMVLPLYASLQIERQAKVFQHVGKNVRKIIVCTNIAETSLTVDGVRYVVDTGFVKQKVYDPLRGMESLVVVPISKVSAQQRSGRAGRTRSGKCYRLYSKQSYENLLDESIPEIKRSNLANTMLYLKALGIYDVTSFPYLDPPEEDSIIDALKQLHLLGALDANGWVTERGKDMSQFPLEPRLSRVLLESIELVCIDEVLQIISMLSVEGIFVQPPNRNDKDPDDRKRRLVNRQQFLDSHGDHLTYLKVFQEWTRNDASNKEWCQENDLNFRSLRTATSVYKQLVDLMKKSKRVLFKQQRQRRSADAPLWKEEKHLGDRIRQAFCSGYFMNSARRCLSETVYRCLSNDYKLIHFHPLSALNEGRPPEYVIYHELVQTSRGFMRHVSSVKNAWIQMYYKSEADVNVERLLTGKSRKLQSSGNVNPPTNDTSEIEKSTPPTKMPEKQEKEAAVALARERYLARKRDRQ